MKNNILKISLINAFGVTLYVALVALVFRYAEPLFGKMNNYFGQVAFLMLFVLSVAVVGYLILAKPVMFYLDGAKKEAIKLLVSTIAWIFLATLIALLIQIWI